MVRTTLTLGSLFDGSGGFPLGGLLAGIEPIWASEIEPFPIRVTTKRLPQMCHYGDVSTLHGAELPPVDIITFGSPCQNVSIAGDRSGINGDRSGLFFEAIRIIKEMRCKTNGMFPRWACWENVPGAFSSNGGADFKAVLDAFVDIIEPTTQVPAPENGKWPYADWYMGDGWSIAYRTLDAQYWGVPQRRRRVFLVADFAGGSAGKILFESEGLSGYSPESFRAWQRATSDLKSGVGGPSPICLNEQGSPLIGISVGAAATLRAQKHGHQPCVIHAAGFSHEHSAKSRSIGYGEEVAPTLKASKVPAALYENHSQDTRYTGPLDVAPTVSATFGTGGNNQPLVVPSHLPYTLKVRAGCEGGGKGALVQTNLSATLSCNNDQTLFAPQSAHGPLAFGNGQLHQIDLSTKAGTLTCMHDPQGVIVPRDAAMVGDDAQYTVRRLTPTECARLQGFPDWWCADLSSTSPSEDEIAFWTDIWETHRRITAPAKKPKTRKQIIKWLRSPHSDSAEYRMWGNGVALPCVFFVLAGIAWAAVDSSHMVTS